MMSYRLQCVKDNTQKRMSSPFLNVISVFYLAINLCKGGRRVISIFCDRLDIKNWSLISIFCVNKTQLQKCDHSILCNGLAFSN